MSFNKGPKTPSSGEGVDVQDGKVFSLNGKAFRKLDNWAKISDFKFEPAPLQSQKLNFNRDSNARRKNGKTLMSVLRTYLM